jgi:hypothetical protein
MAIYMRRIFFVLLLVAVMLILTSENIAMKYSEAIIGAFNIAPRPSDTKIEADIKRLSVINKQDIDRSGNFDTRTVEINGCITPDEFTEIKALVLAFGYEDIHGALYGSLPSYYFGSIQVFLIPKFGFWRENHHSENDYIGLNLVVGMYYDSLGINSYTIYRDSDSMGNPTDTLDNFTLTVNWADTGIENGQIISKFNSYLNYIKKIIRHIK